MMTASFDHELDVKRTPEELQHKLELVRARLHAVEEQNLILENEINFVRELFRANQTANDQYRSLVLTIVSTLPTLSKTEEDK